MSNSSVNALFTEFTYQPVVVTKWHGQTNHKPARVIATNVTSGKRVTVSWDYALDVATNHLKAALELFAEAGIVQPEKVVGCGTKTSDGYYFTAVIPGSEDSLTLKCFCNKCGESYRLLRGEKVRCACRSVVSREA